MQNTPSSLCGPVWQSTLGSTTQSFLTGRFAWAVRKSITSFPRRSWKISEVLLVLWAKPGHPPAPQPGNEEALSSISCGAHSFISANSFAGAYSPDTMADLTRSATVQKVFPFHYNLNSHLIQSSTLPIVPAGLSRSTGLNIYIRFDKRVFSRRTLNSNSGIVWRHAYARCIRDDEGKILEFDLNVQGRAHNWYSPLVH